MSQSRKGKPPGFRSLRDTLAISFLTLAVAVLVVASFVQMYISFQAQRELIAKQQQLIADEAAKEVDHFIKEKISLLRMTASRGPEISIKDLKRDARSLIAEPSFRQILLLDAQREKLAKISRMWKFREGCLTNGIERELREVLFYDEGETYISAVCIDETTNEPLIVMGVPVKDVFGNFQGILAAEVNLKYMWDLVAGLKVGENGVAYVVNKQGDLLAYKEIDQVLERKNLINLEEVNEFVKKEDKLNYETQAELSRGIEGNLVVANHSHLEGPNWAVVVELPAAEAYRTVIYGTGFSIGIIILCAILAIVVGVFLSKKITGPIIKLRDVAAEIGKGKLDAKIEIESKNEIGELAAGFNDMAAKLKELYETLEAKVEERTEELEEAKASLEIKVTARTKELKELAERQEETIKERTKEIHERMKALEKFHRLAVGRELKMVELKKELKKIKEELEKYKPRP